MLNVNTHGHTPSETWISPKHTLTTLLVRRTKASCKVGLILGKKFDGGLDHSQSLSIILVRLRRLSMEWKLT